MNATIFVRYNQTRFPEVFGKKVVFKNFLKFTENTCARLCLFNKVEGLRPTPFLKRDSNTGVFS